MAGGRRAIGRPLRHEPAALDQGEEPAQLVLGFGNLGERAIRDGIATVADLLRR